MDFPCKDCDKRYVGCHTSCEEYMIARKQKDEINKDKEKKRRVYNALYDMTRHRLKSTARRKG